LEPSQIDFLSKKMTDLQIHLDKRIEDKKSLVHTYTEEIKATKKRMTSFARSIYANDETFLSEVMDPIELDEFFKKC